MSFINDLIKASSLMVCGQFTDCLLIFNVIIPFSLICLLVLLCWYIFYPAFLLYRELRFQILPEQESPAFVLGKIKMEFQELPLQDFHTGILLPSLTKTTKYIVTLEIKEQPPLILDFESKELYTDINEGDFLTLRYQKTQDRWFNKNQVQVLGWKA